MYIYIYVYIYICIYIYISRYTSVHSHTHMPFIHQTVKASFLISTRTPKNPTLRAAAFGSAGWVGSPEHPAAEKDNGDQGGGATEVWDQSLGHGDVGAVSGSKYSEQVARFTLWVCWCVRVLGVHAATGVPISFPPRIDGFFCRTLRPSSTGLPISF